LGIENKWVAPVLNIFQRSFVNVYKVGIIEGAEINMGKAGLLGELEQLVLLATLRLDGKAYAVPILDELQSKTGLKLSRGSVYVTLDRLEQKGYLESWFAEPTRERGGKAKRFFRLTGVGAEALRRSRSALAKMWEGQEPALEKL
jgi:DNA-binding PadR family transcriptional regulator